MGGVITGNRPRLTFTVCRSGAESYFGAWGKTSSEYDAEMKRDKLPIVILPMRADFIAVRRQPIRRSHEDRLFASFPARHEHGISETRIVGLSEPV